MFLSTSKNTQIYNNLLDNNLRGITYFFNCASVGHGSIFYDLTNNTSHDNTIINTRSGAWAINLAYWSTCTAAQVEPYKNGSKNLTFSNNTYDVESPTTGQYWWFWDGFKTWSEWQILGHDTTGTVQ